MTSTIGTRALACLTLSLAGSIGIATGALTPASATTSAVATPSAATIARAATQPIFRQSAARYGIRHSRSVRNLQARLIRGGFATTGLRQAGTTGAYLKQTRASVRQLQTKLGYHAADADGIIGRASATRLGLRWIPVAATVRPVAAPATPGVQSKRALTAAELKSVLKRAGFREPSIRVAWAIAMRESRGYPAIVSQLNSNGTRDHGLFQINDVHRGTADFSRIYDPVYNAQIAYGMTSGGSDFSAWGIGDKGWAGYLHKTSPKYWDMLQKEMLRFKAQYPG